jgi:hypothetical protein
MKKHYIITVLLVFLVSACLLYGCSPEADAPAKSVEPQKATESPLECNWLLKVDQTIPVTSDELTVNHTLVFIAEKEGGTDVYGVYNGAAYISSELDASNLSNSFFDVSGGFDVKAFANNLSFEIVPYDKEEYSRYGLKKDDPPLVPLVEYESMALFSAEMTGTGIVNPSVTGENVNAGYNDSASGTAPIVMRIAVKSGKVEVDVPAFNVGSTFKGLLTGDPQQSGEEYQQAMAKIESLINESEQEEQEEDNEGEDLSDSLGGIMGTLGTNLPLPDSFPVDVLPLASDANIINVYESEDGKNIRVMFGTATEYEDLLNFYSPVIDNMDNKIDMDNGVIYTGSSKEYRNIQLMIMEDQSQTYKNMVSLEVLKK